MSNFMTKEDAIEIMKGISKKTPQGIMNGYDVVGHIEWQMYLMRDYLKLDGTPLSNASNDYDELLKFAQDNSLITADTTDKSLFKYDSTTDVLTLPDYTVQPPSITLIPQIKYKKTTSMWEKVEIGRFVATAPSHYEREQLYTTNKTTITIYPTWINIDDIGYVLENPKTIDITNPTNWDNSSYATASNRAGKDFYIYACKSVSATEPTFVLSANSTTPTGYTANDSRKMGGFHCLCVDVGTISGHTLTGYLAGEILPNSPWDLNFRAESENEGMVWIPQIGLWGDIYFASWNGSQLVSVYNGVPVTGTSSKAIHGIMLAEELGLVKKFLPKYDDFIVSAKGTPEGSHISTDASPTGAGGHIDKSSRRIISNYGLEDCCGVLWQWSKDTVEYTPGSTWNSNNYWLDGLSWQDKPVYNPTVDTVKRGSCYGLLRRLVFGGGYGNAVSYCGSRTVDCGNFGARLYAYIGGRGFSRKR